MSVIEMKQQLGEIIETLPESNLKVVLDFAMYLKEKGKKAMIKKTSQGIAESTFGIWHDEVDGIEYMDKMCRRDVNCQKQLTMKSKFACLLKC